MGAPENELQAWDAYPQHEVTLQAFWMSKYPVTQAQWRSVASLPKVKLSLDPDPSNYKGDKRPVETISWDEAVEFCKRLSAYTKDIYTLPSESQWEYACRAKTTTPFYFGETISPEQANYDGYYNHEWSPAKGYVAIPKEDLKECQREETTDVGSFSPNAFGLYDMHGNVWEWCLDHFHDSYKGSPADGKAWLTGGNSSYRMVRGGSWNDFTFCCQSHYRTDRSTDSCSSNLGFRIVRPTAAIWGY